MIEGWAGLAPAIGEIALLSLACTVLLYDAFAGDGGRRLTAPLSIGALLALLLLLIQTWPSDALITLGGHYVADPLASLLKIVATITAAIVFVYSRRYVADRGIEKGEYWILSLFGLLGIFVLSSAYSFLTLYLGLELLSLSLYALVAFDRNSSVSAESAMKYFVLGAIASGALLYGFSLVYGVTGALSLGEVASASADLDQGASLVLVVGIAFMVVGVAFKLGGVPFHMWLPDVYHGAPTSVTMYVATVSKVGALALALRLLQDGLAGHHADWQGMLVVVTMLSLAVGNIVAIAQTNVKRLLAYSAISHVGFILLGLSTGTPMGNASALLYTIVYVLMAAGAFGVIILLTRAGFEADELTDLAGLNERSRWFAGIMLVMMFSMAGLPPFLGFHAKVAIIQATLDAGYTWLAVYAILMSVIGAFYYIRVIKLMYFDSSEHEPTLMKDPTARVVLSANGLAVLLLGFFPAPLLTLCVAVIAGAA
ncbi:MAG: NADH-quinone oxidoreductase subunit NuoN [Pseudomonadota bacterium]